MKILFFSDHFKPEPTAAASHIYERCKYWAAWGHQVTVVCSAPNFPEGQLLGDYKNRWRQVETLDGVRVVRVKTFIRPNTGFALRILDYASYSLAAAIAAFFESRPDVILSSSPHLFVPLPAWFHGFIRHIPHVFEVRDLWPESILGTQAMGKGFGYRVLEWLATRLYRSATRIVALSPSFVPKIVRHGVAEDKIDVVINGANLDLFSPRSRDVRLETELNLAGRFVVGYLGTMGMAHGLENAVRAAARVRGAGITLLFVGPGPRKPALQALAEELGAENVVFVPPQAKESMPAYWSLCDIGLVHLRDSEVFQTVIPSKIFETMAMGLPVVFVGPEGEGSRLVRDIGAGVIVPPDDPEVLAEAWIELRDDRERRAQYGRNNVARAPEFSRERHAERSLAVIEKAVTGTGKAVTG